VTKFNQFADRVADIVAHVGFFVFCVLLVIIWVPSKVIFKSGDTWQLIINTTTTIITFLLVALLHNTQHRGDAAMNERLEELIRAIEGAKDPVDDKPAE
jgi:low affinity Fe/Cu permease